MTTETAVVEPYLNDGYPWICAVCERRIGTKLPWPDDEEEYVGRRFPEGYFAAHRKCYLEKRASIDAWLRANGVSAEELLLKSEQWLDRKAVLELDPHRAEFPALITQLDAAWHRILREEFKSGPSKHRAEFEKILCILRAMGHPLVGLPDVCKTHRRG